MFALINPSPRKFISQETRHISIRVTHTRSNKITCSIASIHAVRKIYMICRLSAPREQTPHLGALLCAFATGDY